MQRKRQIHTLKLFSSKPKFKKDTKMQNQKHSNIISYRNHDDWPRPHHRHQDLLTRVYIQGIVVMCFPPAAELPLLLLLLVLLVSGSICKKGRAKSGDDEDSAGDDDDHDVSITKSTFLHHPHRLKH